MILVWFLKESFIFPRSVPELLLKMPHTSLEAYKGPPEADLDSHCSFPRSVPQEVPVVGPQNRTDTIHFPISIGLLQFKAPTSLPGFLKTKMQKKAF